MGLPRSQFNKILNIIDQRRLKNQQEHQHRKDTVYKTMPRIHEIDVMISSKTLSMTRKILENPSERETISMNLQEEIRSLSEKKRQLLLDAGYDADYLSPIYDCYDCHDTGFVDNEKCHCLQKEIISHAYSQSNLDDILAVENFDQFKLDYYSNEIDKSSGKSPRAIAERNYKICYSFASDFGNSYQNLILHGQAGLGKTYLCNCIAKEVLDHGSSVIYLTAFNLFKLLENYRFHNDDAKITLDEIQAIYQCDLLIIDDLGTEINNAFTTSELFSLINSRLLDKKPIVISTNLSPSGWSNQYSDRIVSRIYGNYLSLGFVGSDIRLQKLLG